MGGVSFPPIPAGCIQMYGGSTAPGGWILCNGQNVSRTQYANLFKVLGTTYGAGDGSTTFGLPNFVGRMPIGLYTADSSFNTLGETGGEKNHTLTAAEIPSHTHNMNNNVVNDAGLGTKITVASGSTYGLGYGASYATDGGSGGGGAHNNMPPYVVINFIIKY